MMKRFVLLCVVAALGIAPLGAEELPPDWSSATLDACDRFPGLLATPAAALLRESFSQFKLALTRDARVSGASLKWQFTANTPDAQALIFLSSPPAADGFALSLKNPALAPLELFARLTDANGETWKSAPVSLAGGKGWRQFLFLLADFKGARPYPAAPYQTLEFVVNGLQSRKPYELYLDELQTLTAPPPNLRLSDLQAASAATAGQSLPVHITAAFTGQGTRPVTLTARLLRGATPAALTTVSVIPDVQRPQPLNLSLPIPRHLAGGAYRLSFTCSGAELAAVPEGEIAVEAPAAFAAAGLKPPAQGGCLTVDGTPLPLVGGWFTPGQMPLQAPWVILHCTADFDPTGQSAPVWLGPDKFSYTELEARLAAVLSANPDAYVLPLITLASPPWWDAAHPKELMVFGDGKTVLPASVPGAKRTAASWASPLWRKDASAALTRLVQHLEQSPFAPAIIGYQLASGEDDRWVYPGASQGVFADYSAPQHEAFRKWLQEKYKTVKALREAWSQPANPVTTPEALKEAKPILGFNQVRIPDQATRLRGPSGVLHDPNAAQEVVDYQVFASDLVAETIRLFAGVVRQTATRRVLVGAAYGHMFDLAATRYGLQNGGQLALAPICQAEELDFITSNGTFGEPGGPPLLTTAFSSVTSHQKAWVTLARAQQAPAAWVGGLSGGGLVALEGYAPAKLPAALRALPPTLDRSSVAEIALIVDDISAAYTSCGPELVKPLLSDQRVSLSLLGAPVDVWTLDDLMEGRAAGYKLYFFVDCFYLDAQWRKQLASLLAQQPCTALWVYAPGAIDLSLGGRTMKDLTGMTLVPWVQHQPADLEAPGRVDKGLLQVRVGGEGGYVYGSPQSLSPRFICVDDKADIRGMLMGTTLGGLAVKEVGTLKSVWSAAPHLPASLLKLLATEAEVHMYGDDGDGVYLNRSLIAVRAARDGEHVVRLPQLAQVYDLADGRPLGKQATEFRVSLKAGQIGLYYYGPAPLTGP